jgi:hypothetical protein
MVLSSAIPSAPPLPAGRRRITVGAKLAYDTADLVAGLRQLSARPHVAQNLSGASLGPGYFVDPDA